MLALSLARLPVCVVIYDVKLIGHGLELTRYSVECANSLFCRSVDERRNMERRRDVRFCTYDLSVDSYGTRYMYVPTVQYCSNKMLWKVSVSHLLTLWRIDDWARPHATANYCFSLNSPTVPARQRERLIRLLENCLQSVAVV